MTENKLTLSLLDGRYALVRLDPEAGVPTWAARGEFWSVTRNSEVVSVVCAEDAPPDFVARERGWRTLKLQGTVRLSDVGILEAITHPLAESGVSIYLVSTYDTAYVLIQEEQCERALAALTAFGHTISQPS